MIVGNLDVRVVAVWAWPTVYWLRPENSILRDPVIRMLDSPSPVMALSPLGTFTGILILTSPDPSPALASTFFPSFEAMMRWRSRCDL